MSNVIDIELPEITEAIQVLHGGERAAIVDGKFIAFAENSVELAKKAAQLGYSPSQFCITFIPRLGVSYI